MKQKTELTIAQLHVRGRRNSFEEILTMIKQLTCMLLEHQSKLRIKAVLLSLERPTGISSDGEARILVSAKLLETRQNSRDALDACIKESSLSLCEKNIA